MRINERMKRALSILLCVMMLVQYVPTHAFAATTDNLCDHNYVGAETAKPTCYAVGMMTYTCDVCGDSYEEEIKAYHDGNLEYHAAKDPVDCATPGNIEYWYCPGCDGYFADANAEVSINPGVIKITGDCERPEGAADCATLICEICGQEIYGYGEHDVVACQGGVCGKCGEEIEGIGCQNYDTPACEDGICYYCGGFVAGLGHENGAWAPCIEGECAYGCGLLYPATKDHIDDDNDNYCDTCWECANHVAPDSHDPCDGYDCENCGKWIEGQHTGGTATCTTQAVCDDCGASYGELADHGWESGECTVCGYQCDHDGVEYKDNGDGTHDKVCGVCGYVEVDNEAHTMDITTGKCGECGADMTAIATVTDGTNTYYAADADTLNQAVTAILETGSRTFTVELPADAEAGLITAIRRAICDTEGVADGSIHLTLKGVTSIPGTTNWDGVAFAPGEITDETGGLLYTEIVTQLASVKLPDVTEIGAQAFLECSNLTSITAPKVQSIGDWGLQSTAITSIDMPLLKEAGFAAFHSTALTEVSLPSLETAGNAAFGLCEQLRTVDLPKLQNLSQQLFTRCTSLVAVNAPAATSMGNNVFKGCSELVSITLPGVTELTYEAFAECTKLENITFGSVITKVNANLFDGEALSSNITLTLNCGQEKAETLPATAGTNVAWAGFTWKEVKFAHSYVNSKCTACGEDCAHTGGTATCTTPAVCESCGASYGDLLDHNWENGECTYGCSTPHDPHSWKSGTCTVCGLVCTHESFENGTCTLCGISFMEGYGRDSDDSEFLSPSYVSGSLVTSSDTSVGTSWSDETGTGNLNFRWGNGDELDVTAVISDETVAYEKATVQPHLSDAHRMQFPLSAAYGEGTPVIAARGFDEYFHGDFVTGGTGSVANVFTQTASGNPGFLSGDMLMYGAAEIANGTASLEFQHIPATFRFIITNTHGEALTLDSVTLRVVDADGTPVAAASKDCVITVEAGDGYQESFPGYGTYDAVTTNITGGTLEPGQSYIAYALALPLGKAESGAFNEAAFKDKTIQVTVTTSEGACIAFELAADKLAAANPGNAYNWVGGKSYTMRMETRCADGCTFDATGNCTLCGYQCSHDGMEYKDNCDGTHDKVCSECGYVEVDNEAHTPAENTTYSDNGNGTHSFTCAVCGNVTEEHAFDENGTCVCGLRAYVYDESTNTYTVYNAEGLYHVAALVNGGQTAINITLGNDIVVNEGVMEKITVGSDGTVTVKEGQTLRGWTAIGNQDNPYGGAFRGQGYSVSGIFYEGLKDCVGLLGYVDSSGTVQDVGVINSCIRGSWYVGGVVGRNKGTVTGCYNTSRILGDANVGGVVGLNEKGTVTGCYNTGNVSSHGNDFTGGVVGSSYSGSTVTNCYNTGTVTAESSYTGGVVGYCYGSVITNCYNTGKVSSSGAYYIGGVTGRLQYRSAVSNCYYLLGTADGGVDSADTAGAAAKDIDAFNSGEVAYLLNGDQSNIAFYQTLGQAGVPGFTGQQVYYGYESCLDTEIGYTNNSGAMDAPNHMGGSCSATGNTITDKCVFCGTEVLGTAVLSVQDKTYDGTPVTAVVDVTGTLEGKEITVTYCCQDGCKTAGEHTVSAALGELAVSAAFTIEKRELTLKLTDCYKEYDGTANLTTFYPEVEGFIFYDEGSYESDTLDYDDVYDDVRVDAEKLTVTLPGTKVGAYTTARVSGITLIGEDAANYTIAAEIAEVPLEGYHGDFEIGKAYITISSEDQVITGENSIAPDAWTVNELPQGHTIHNVVLEPDEDDTYILVNTESVTITDAGGSDVTDCFEIQTDNSGVITRVHEGHSFNANGFCATGECDNYQSAVAGIMTDEWGNESECYLIYNAGQLYWFAQQINEYGSNYINGKLMADITVNADLTAENLRAWTPIASGYPAYTGHFDGNGKTISGLYVKSENSYVGLFGGTDYAYQIKNIHITNSYFEGNSAVGALIGYAGSYISGCTVSDSVTVVGNSSVGGIVGDSAYGELTNCWSAATVTEAGEPGAGLVGDNRLTITNCYTTASRLVSYGDGEITNSYYLSETETEDGGKTDAQFAGGQVAYLLGDAFGQAIGTDTYPIFGGKKVYQIANTGCTVHGDYGYSNDENAVFAPAHEYDKGVCVCGTACLHEGEEFTCIDNGDGTHDKVYADCGYVIVDNEAHNGTPSYAVNTEDSGKHDVTYDCCGGIVTADHTADETIGQTCLGYRCIHCGEWHGEASNSAHAFADDNETCKYCQQIIVAKVSRDGVVSYYTAIEDVAPNDDESNYAKLTLLANYTMKGNGNLGYTSLERVGDVTITVPNEYTLMVYYTAEWIDAEGYFVNVGKWDGRKDYGKFTTYYGRSYLLKDLTIESFGRTSGHSVTVTKDATLTLTGASSISEQLVVYGELVLTENATLRNTGTTYLVNDIYQSVDDIPAGLTGGSVRIKGITYTYVSGGSTDEKDHAPYWSCNSHVCQDSKADCITRDHCDHCGDVFGELGGHAIDITTGNCVICNEYIAVATVTDGTTTLHADTGENLSTAIKQLMDGGSRTITVDLPGYDMITDVCSAVSDASAGEVRTVHLTVKGLTMIGEDTGFASMTQLATLSLPDVTYLYEYALRYTELERLELTAEEEITVEREVIDSDIVGLVDLVLCCNKADEVSDGVYWKGFTFKSVTFTEHDYVDGVCTVCGTICDHSGSRHTTAADNEDGTHSFTCSVCGETAKASHTGGTATCQAAAVCSVCGASYGDLDPDNHTYESNACCGYCGDPAVNGGKDVVWTLVDGKLSITGSGAMANIDGEPVRPWFDMRDSITSVTIDEGVTTIGYGAFELCVALEDVKLPAGMTTIGEFAFSFCSKLTEISIPNTVTVIDQNAFSYSGLTAVEIPAGVITIGNYAFDNCDDLAAVTIPNTVTTMGHMAFYDCNALTDITIPASVETIGSAAFDSCDALETVNVPCTWEVNPLYTFADTVTVNIADHAYENGKCVCGLYDLWVAGEQISESHLTVTGTTGTATYDPATDTLTLNGFDNDFESYSFTNKNGSLINAAVYSISDLNVVLEGENCLGADGFGLIMGIWSDAALTIGGDGAILSCPLYSANGTIINGGTLNIPGVEIAFDCLSTTINGGSVNVSVNQRVTIGTLTVNGGRVVLAHESFAIGFDCTILIGEGMAVYDEKGALIENPDFETLQYALIQAPCDHTQATPSYTWTEDPITLTVTVSCTACGETFTGSTTDMDVTVSDDGFTTTYTATVTLDGKEYTDSKVVSNQVTSVNITWGSMNFTYTDESGWNNPDTAWVQVENTGNTPVNVTYTYVTERTDITGSFFDGTATVTAPVAVDTETTKKIWLRLDGKPGEALNNAKIGSVKLTIE